MDTENLTSKPGNKRGIDFVSPCCHSDSPDLTTHIADSQLSEFKMVDANNEKMPGWFLKFDNDFDRRVGEVVDSHLDKKLAQVSQEAREARDFAKESRDNCEELEKRLDSVAQENIDLRKVVESLQSKVANLEAATQTTQNELQKYRFLLIR